MNHPADCVHSYILAKDGNRPHLLATTFADDVELRIIVETDAISFPPASTGRAALADVLVRRFNQTYENIYTFCLGAPPGPEALTFCCRWLVAMTEKESTSVRVGCGRYEWAFTEVERRVSSLLIRIVVMESLPATTIGPVMSWVSSLPYPWCTEAAMLEAVPSLAQLDNVVRALSTADA